MSWSQIFSRCECQARLSATLDEKRHVLSGWAIRDRRPAGAAREPAPAHSIGAERELFDVAWACPFCGRNTLRTFEAGALRWTEDQEQEQGQGQEQA